MRFTGEEPTLALATATPVDVVSCTSPSAGSFADSLSFLYVVSPGDYSSDLSYTDTEALSLVSGAGSSASSVALTTEIVDEFGDPASVTLPAVGSVFSVTGGEEWQALEAALAGSGALVVDTSNEVLYVTALNGDGVYYAGESIFIQARLLVLTNERSAHTCTAVHRRREEGDKNPKDSRPVLLPDPSETMKEPLFISGRGEGRLALPSSNPISLQLQPLRHPRPPPVRSRIGKTCNHDDNRWCTTTTLLCSGPRC